MMNQNRILWLLPVLLMAGCQPVAKPFTDDNRLQGTWTLYEVSPMSGNITDDNIAVQMKNDLEVGSIISLFKDSSFTKTEGNGEFAAGDWHMNRDTDRMMLTTRTGMAKDTLLYIESPSFDRTKRALIISREGFIYRYEKTGVSLADEKTDPFYRTNNQWRITPHDDEDSARIKERLANYIRHLALLLKAAKERKETEVSFIYSGGPVTIDESSIGILPFQDIRRSWKNGFYSDEAAAYAYVLYAKYLSKPHTTEARTGDWIEDDYHTLMSMYPAFHASRREAVKVR